MSKPSPYAYPWIVGHRLRSSRVRLPYRKALEYFKSLKHCKTRKMWQDVPLDVVVSNVAQKYFKHVQKLLSQKNVILEAFKRHGVEK